MSTKQWVFCHHVYQSCFLFDNPRPIQWLGCMIILDFLRRHFMGLDRLAYRLEKLTFDKIDLRKRKIFLFNVFKMSFICIILFLFCFL